MESLIRAGAFDSLGANRCQCMAVYETAMDAGAGKRKQTVSGQLSLFDIGQAGEDMRIADEFPALPEYPYRELLSQEKEMTGVYISGHPLDEYTEELDRFSFSSASLAELEDLPDHGASLDGTSVSMGGIVIECHAKATKKGSMMGFVTLEDLTGQVEGLLFPKVWEIYGRSLQQDETVVLTGKLSIREDESPKLLVDMVEPLSRKADAAAIKPAPVDRRTDAQIAKDAKEKLYLRMERAQLSACESVLREQTGNVPVYVNLPAEGITILMPRACWVSSGRDTEARLMHLLPR